MAHERGFQCSHLNHLGMTGHKDRELKSIIIGGEWTFVTNNSIDFRGPADKPGSSGEYADVTLHAGLVCITAPGGLSLAIQRQLFELILNDLVRNGDLINQVLEVVLDRGGEVQATRREMPKN